MGQTMSERTGRGGIDQPSRTSKKPMVSRRTARWPRALSLVAMPLCRPRTRWTTTMMMETLWDRSCRLLKKTELHPVVEPSTFRLILSFSTATADKVV